MKDRAVAALALLPTALLLFVSPAVRLYVRNQDDLHHQSAVLVPFVWLALGTVALGALAWALSTRRGFRYLTWAYLLLAPCLLAFRVLQGQTLPSLLGLLVGWSLESGTGLVLWLSVWLLGAFALSRRFAPAGVATFMAAFGIVLLVGDVAALSSATRSRRALEHNLRSVSAPPKAASAANVYHIVLDELQTDALELLRSSEVDASLGGFVYFRNNETIYHATVMSLSSTFTGRRYLYDEPRRRYIESGFGERSFVRLFADAGYWTLAIVPGSDPLTSSEDGFAVVVHHADNVERSPSTNAAAFNNLWIVANVPAVVVDTLASRGWLSERTQEELRMTRAGRALTDSAPVASAMSFRELVAKEPELTDIGRYTFAHFLIPHSPYVLRSDCDYLEWERSEDPLAQTTCTLALVTDLLDAIDASQRFDEALIVIHGDHGAPFRTRDGRLVRARARSSRTPLLIKEPGRSRGEAFVECDTKATLLDIAPTILDYTGLRSEGDVEGASLADAVTLCRESAGATSTPESR